MVQPLLTVEDLAQILRKSPASIRSDVTRNPLALPPICRIPGTARILWRTTDVERWLSAIAASASPAEAAPPSSRARKKRGRPTKAEARERALIGARG